MIPLPEARQFVLRACRRLEPQSVALTEAAGQVLAEEIHATESIPPFANSAMDGYALRAADTAEAPVALRVVGMIMAGDDPSFEVGPGEAARIMTGAPLPRGADGVCMVELTEDGPQGTVVIKQHVEKDQNVRHPGGDISEGDLVFSPGTLVRAGHIGVLASLGVEAVSVYPRPRVGVISTGDELVVGGGRLAPGKIRDSNRPALLTQLRSDGWDPLDLGRVLDDETALSQAFERGGEACDALVTSGGVSVGDRDLVKVVLEKLSGGSMRWMQIAIKPAKPFAFGTLAHRGTPVFGLPGNPVSTLVSYELLVRPGLRRMAGFPEVERATLLAIARDPLRRRRDGKVHFVRVRVTADAAGALQVANAGGQESHMMRAMADANALAVLPDGDGVGAGEKVSVLVLDPDRVGGAPESSQ